MKTWWQCELDTEPGKWVGLQPCKADGSWGKRSPLELQPAPRRWQAAQEEEGCGVAMTIEHLQILGLFIFGFVLAE